MNRLLPAVLGLLAGCVAPSSRLTPLDTTPRPAVDTAHVQVLEAEPERSFRVIALWEGEETSAYGEQVDVLVRRAREAAAGLGADAVIVEAATDNGLPVQASGIPGVATDGGATTFETVTRVKARIVVWEGPPPPEARARR